jgi:hypothetical protein
MIYIILYLMKASSVMNLLPVMYGMNNIKFYLPINSYVCMEHLCVGGKDVLHGIVGPCWKYATNCEWKISDDI